MSAVFNFWNEAVSGRIKSDTRISGTITYNTFPFPETTVEQDQRIDEKTGQMLDIRE